MTDTPTRTLNNTYVNAIVTFPLLIKSPVSKAKVENVVKPPHTPTFKNKIKLFNVDGLILCTL